MAHPHPPPHVRVDPLAGLSADTPIVLLPVRVETRWYPGSDPAHLELRIRVFPDEIHVAAPRTVTARERADVAAYFAAVTASGTGGEVATSLYAQLVETAGASRAGWLVRALAPGAPPVPDADSDATPALASALPDHWIAIVKAPGLRAIATGTRITQPLAASPSKHDEPSAATQPALGKALEWVTSFATAEQAGMALRLQVAAADAARLDELVVIGVRAGTPEQGAVELGDLIARHAAMSNAALLPWGTATNVAGVRDDRPATGATAPWRGPGGRPLAPIGATPAGDPARAITALGITATDALDVVADPIDRDAITRAMHVAMWPATWGYYLKELASQADAAIASARALYLDHVRPQGPLPALAVHAQPYGILPATSLARWPQTAARGGFATFLRNAEATWQGAVAHVPRLVDTQDLDKDLVAILRRQPASSGAWVRRVTDVDTAAVSLGGNPAGWVQHIQDELERIARAVQAMQLGLPTSMPILDIVYADTLARVRIPFVAPAETPRDAALPHDYLTAITHATASQLDTHDVDGATPRTLLYLFARYAAERLRIAVPPLVVDAHPTTAVARTIPASVWTRIADLGQLVFANPAVIEHATALQFLGTQPVGELEAAFSGVLDSASHRLDAWSTAIASERLATLRRTTNPPASYVGGWAWLEKPRPRTVPAPNGFIHAPSVSQARTAAVLRAGYEAHRADGAGTSLEIDLSSERVRRARWLLDGVRDGRPLGGLLGDHVERWLVARSHGTLIDDVRALSAPGVTPPPVLTDGWALYHTWSEARPNAPYDALFDELVEIVDAVADLLVADSVHNALAQSPARASAALDALQRGEIAAPDPRVDRTATDGARTQHQIVLLLADRPGWPGGPRPRATASPRLEGLAAAVLGDPGVVTIATTSTSGGTSTTITRTLADLDLCALDVVALVRDGSARSLLDRARATVAEVVDAIDAIEGGPELDELVLRAAALGRLFATARTPAAGDLGAMTITAPAAQPAPTAPGLEQYAAPAGVSAPTATEPVVPSQAGELEAWLSDLSRVRTALEPLDLLTLLAPALFPLERRRTRGELELTFAGTGNQALVVDAWSDAAPATDVTTGVAFPYDAPRAQPPQTVLVAVPPPAVSWTLELVEAIIDETIARARMRMIAPEDVRAQLAPALLVLDDPKDLSPALDLQVVSAVFQQELSQ